jgi:hypothetical protein
MLKNFTVPSSFNNCATSEGYYSFKNLTKNLLQWLCGKVEDT